MELQGSSPQGLTLLGQILERLEDHAVHIAIDKEGIVTTWNPEAEALFGWPAEEAVGQPLTALIIPEPLHAAHCEGLRRWNESGQSTVACQRLRTVARHKDGHHLAVLVDVQVIQTADGTRFLGWAREILDGG